MSHALLWSELRARLKLKRLEHNTKPSLFYPSHRRRRRATLLPCFDCSNCHLDAPMLNLQRADNGGIVSPCGRWQKARRRWYISSDLIS